MKRLMVAVMIMAFLIGCGKTRSEERREQIEETAFVVASERFGARRPIAVMCLHEHRTSNADFMFTTCIIVNNSSRPWNENNQVVVLQCNTVACFK